MKSSVYYSILCSAILSSAQCYLAAAEPKPAVSEASLSREEAVLVSITAKVKAIDYKTRELTLQGPLGNEVTLVADPAVKRLNEIKVGDNVRADYYVSIAAELRKPTKAEKEHPIVLLDAAGKAPPGTAPAAGGLRRFKVLTTVEGLDRPTQTITVKGPGGNYLTARVADPARLTKARIGDNIVITYTEALAVSLEKTERKTSE